MFTLSVVVLDLQTDCVLSFLFPAETDVLVPVFSQSTDVVVVNFVVVHVQYTFLYISLRSLDHYGVKMPNFTFYGGRKQVTRKFFSLFQN